MLDNAFSSRPYLHSLSHSPYTSSSSVLGRLDGVGTEKHMRRGRTHIHCLYSGSHSFGVTRSVPLIGAGICSPLTLFHFDEPDHRGSGALETEPWKARAHHGQSQQKEWRHWEHHAEADEGPFARRDHP